RDEVDLELGRQHAASGRHEAERGIPGRGVSDGADGSGMNEAVLLRNGGMWSEGDLDMARRHVAKRCAERAHQPLLRETRSDPLHVALVVRHRGSLPRITAAT